MKTLLSISLEGTTPQGRDFTLKWQRYDGESEIVGARLEWAAFGDVGSVGVPLNIQGHIGLLYYELTRHGRPSESTLATTFCRP